MSLPAKQAAYLSAADAWHFAPAALPLVREILLLHALSVIS